MKTHKHQFYFFALFLDIIDNDGREDNFLGKTDATVTNIRDLLENGGLDSTYKYYLYGGINNVSFKTKSH